MKPELLMPAGSLDKLKWCLNYGADAVYAGVPQLSLRARENEFDLEALATGTEEAHRLSKKIYFTANIFARNLKLKTFRSQISEWAKLKPDALIMSDPGLISIAKETHPEIPIHLSVQANCMNWEAVTFWQKIGISRIILSRELRLEEIKKIKDMVPDIELEAFVHGSICIAFSGRCLLSHYMNYRDANQGVCDNSCRYPYRTFTQEKGDNEFFIQDLREPTEFYPIDEDEHGTYIMNSKDLCLVEHLKEIRDAGVCSFKVEGRSKSEFYAAMISKIYRKAIDDMMADKPFDPALLRQLEEMVHRGYHKGFMMGNPPPDSQNYKPGNRAAQSKFLGLLDSNQMFDVRNKIKRGDEVKLFLPNSEVQTKVEHITNIRGESLEVLHPGSGKFQVRFAHPVSEPALVTGV